MVLEKWLRSGACSSLWVLGSLRGQQGYLSSRERAIRGGSSSLTEAWQCCKDGHGMKVPSPGRGELC